MSGEIDLILENLKKETEIVLHDLANVENALVKLQETILNKSIDKNFLINEIQKIRDMIGTLERVDVGEFDEEKSAENLMVKLRCIVDKCI